MSLGAQLVDEPLEHWIQRMRRIESLVLTYCHDTGGSFSTRKRPNFPLIPFFGNVRPKWRT